MSEPKQQSRWHLSPTANRHAMHLASANAGLWAIGNGLVATQLVIYLANSLGYFGNEAPSHGLWVALVLAAPRFAGLMRLAAPALIARLGNRKAVCLLAYAISAAVLGLIPIIAQSARWKTGGTAMSMLIVVWCLYHLLEYVATVALWSWLGDLTPRRIRGRLLGGREQWLLIGRIVGIGASALLATLWSYLLPSAPQWQPLALSAEIGAVMMLFAVAPLAAMPAARGAPSALPRLPWRSLARAALDPQYRRLLAASCWIAAVNGLTQAPQELYPIRVLRLPYAGRLALLAMMRAGQSAIAPWMGRLTDRLGNRPVMIVSQFIAATGTLFLLAATPEYRWLLIGAYVVWIAYAGLNVGLDNAKLKLAPPENNAPYLAVYHAMSDLAGGAAIVAGGVLFDQLAATAGGSLHHYAQIFIWAWLGRTSAVILLARLIEPDARRVSEFVAG